MGEARQAATCVPRLPARPPPCGCTQHSGQHGASGVLGGQGERAASLPLQSLGRSLWSGACPFAPRQVFFWGGFYGVPGAALLVQTLTSNEALCGRANKCASPEQPIGCLGAQSPAAEARGWGGGVTATTFALRTKPRCWHTDPASAEAAGWGAQGHMG